MEQIETRVIKPEVTFFENEVNNLIISSQEESVLDSRVEDIESFMKNNSGKGKTEEEKDLIYQQSQDLWNLFVNSLKE